MSGMATEDGCGEDLARTAKKMLGRMTEAIVMEMALASATPMPTDSSGCSRTKRTRAWAWGKRCTRQDGGSEPEERRLA